MDNPPTAGPRFGGPDACVKAYEVHYAHFESPVYAEVRREAYGDDVGQYSWVTADELRRFAAWLEPTAESHILDVASGAGGPTLFLAETANCRVTGLDIDPHGVAYANRMARERRLDGRVRFQVSDASRPLPFGENTFDAVICMDAVGHLGDRRKVLSEWHRALRPGGRLVFTDPITVTGSLAHDEVAVRGSIGHVEFTPEGANHRILEALGFHVLRREDTTERVAAIAKRRHDARERRREPLVEIEGAETFERLQRFFQVAHRVAAEGRLSRDTFVARKR